MPENFTFWILNNFQNVKNQDASKTYNKQTCFMSAMLEPRIYAMYVIVVIELKFKIKDITMQFNCLFITSDTKKSVFEILTQ